MQNSPLTAKQSEGAEVALSLSHSSDSSLDDLLAVLQWGSFYERWDAAKKIPELSHRAQYPIELLISQLVTLLEEDEDWELAWFITRILGDLPHPEAIARLVHLARSSLDEEVTESAVMALSQQGAEAIAPLTELLHCPATGRVAAQSLAQLQHPAAMEVLMQIANAADPSIRTLAIAALSHCHDYRHPDQVFSLLIQALHDPVASIRCSALAGLGGWASFSDLPMSSTALIDQVHPFLWDGDTAVQQQAILTLGRLDTPVAITHLGTVLRSPTLPEFLRIHLIRTLGWSQTAEAITELSQELRQQLVQARSASLTSAPFRLAQEIIAVLGRIESDSLAPLATQCLLDVLQTSEPVDQHPPLRQAIAYSLGCLGQPDAHPALRALTTDVDERVRYHAIAALSR